MQTHSWISNCFRVHHQEIGTNNFVFTNFEHKILCAAYAVHNIRGAACVQDGDIQADRENRKLVIFSRYFLFPLFNAFKMNKALSCNDLIFSKLIKFVKIVNNFKKGMSKILMLTTYWVNVLYLLVIYFLHRQIDYWLSLPTMPFF